MCQSVASQGIGHDEQQQQVLMILLALFPDSCVRQLSISRQESWGAGQNEGLYGQKGAETRRSIWTEWVGY